MHNSAEPRMSVVKARSEALMQLSDILEAADMRPAPHPGPHAEVVEGGRGA